MGTGNALCILQCAEQSHAMVGSPASHATFETCKQVVVYPTTQGDITFLCDDVNGWAMHIRRNR